MGKRYPHRPPRSGPPGGLHAAVVVAEVDLHGFRARQAELRVEGFLRTSRVRHPGEVVRIITGRGNRSEGGRAVLRDVVRDLLDGRLAEHAEEHTVAMGGGAVLVRLAGK